MLKQTFGTGTFGDHMLSSKASCYYCTTTNVRYYTHNCSSTIYIYIYVLQHAQMLQQFRLLQQSELFVGVSNILQHDLLQQFALLQQHSLFHPAFCLAQASYTSPLLCSTFVPFPAVMVRGVLSIAGAKQPVPGYDFQLDPLFTPEIIKTVNDVIANCNRTGEKITGWERVGESLIGAKLAWRCHTPPDCAGVHQSNRSSYGLAGSDAQVHGKKILGAGFSWKKCEDATAIQCPPEPWSAESKSFNDELVALSDNLIPPLAQLQILSIGAGHTNTFLRQVNAGVASVTSLKDASGNLNKQELVINRKAFGEALDKGLNWLVLHWQVMYVFPDLADFVQSALNTTVQGHQTEIEVMLNMHRMASKAIAAGLEVEWKAIEESACASLPHCASWISALTAYVRANAGGDGGELLRELALYAKSFGTSEKGPVRTIGSEFLFKLSGLNWGHGIRYPYVTNAVLEAQLASPPDRITDGVCRLLQSSTLHKLNGKANKDAVAESERLMTEARRLCDSMDLAPAQRMKLVGRLDVRLITFMCRKGKEFEGREYPSIEAITKVVD